ncbi:MAG: TaqI-like C-terminal specificity domain-containing protein [Candidatus Levyibacteriota bacterium]
MDKAKVLIQNLVDRYNKEVGAGKANKYTEEETKNVFIKPFFEALGWDFSQRDEVSAEEQIISSGRVDYGFYINNRPKFYLEAKPLKADLHREEFARQAIRYSFNKGVTWAVLTDFESIKVFNAQAVSNYLGDKLLFEIKYSEYVNRFDELWLLSKESVSEDLIDKEAEKRGKKLQKIPITELLYKDLNECRKLLTYSLGQYNDKVSQDLLDEGVQKLLDRLVFIRVAEDRKIEPSILVPLINQWKTSSEKIGLYESMIKTFREMDAIYNSNLFTPHSFEKWTDDGGALQKVVDILYGEKGYYEYDFSIMPADILGSVYENYLGYKLSQSKKGLSIDKSSEKRKEQGIYYTPTYVVDYIARNALKPILDECKSVNDLKKIKVLDPACGSGSFLIKAMEVILEKYKEFNYEDNENLRVQIILENLYGVDLDIQAVEIARLNLLINALEQKGKLPSLDRNIKNGNSLIAGSDEELRKRFGQSYRDKKPFNWEEEFPEVFKQGGFNVIIGNPPWVSIKGKQKSADFEESELRYFTEVLHADTYRPNLFEMFIWKSLSLLRHGGNLGFVVPDRLSSNAQFEKLRSYILSNFSIRNLLYGAEFPGIIGDIVVIVLSNEENKNNLVKVQTLPSSLTELVQQEYFSKNSSKEMTYSSSMGEEIFQKISKNSRPLGEIANTSVGFIAKANTLTKEKKNDLQIEVFKGENILRYLAKGNYFFEFTKANLAGGTQEKTKLESFPKILIRKTGSDIIASLDEKGIYPEQSLYFIYGGGKSFILSLLVVLNSNLMSWYYKNFAITNRASTPQLKKIHLDKFPIAEMSEADIKKLVILASAMLDLNKRFSGTEENSNGWQKLNDEIEKVNKQIDKEVYMLYELTPEEIKIIENQ